MFVFFINAVLTPEELPFLIGLSVCLFIAFVAFWHPILIPTKLSKVVLILAVLYLIPGTLMNISYLSSEAQTYICGEVTRGGRGYKNPDESRCRRRIKEPWVWSSAASHFLFWPFMIVNM